jgi:hypothetical protein
MTYNPLVRALSAADELEAELFAVVGGTACATIPSRCTPIRL